MNKPITIITISWVVAFTGWPVNATRPAPAEIRGVNEGALGDGRLRDLPTAMVADQKPVPVPPGLIRLHVATKRRDLVTLEQLQALRIAHKDTRQIDSVFPWSRSKGKELAEQGVRHVLLLEHASCKKGKSVTQEYQLGNGRTKRVKFVGAIAEVKASLLDLQESGAVVARWDKRVNTSGAPSIIVTASNSEKGADRTDPERLLAGTLSGVLGAAFDLSVTMDLWLSRDQLADRMAQMEPAELEHFVATASSVSKLAAGPVPRYSLLNGALSIWTDMAQRAPEPAAEDACAWCARQVTKDGCDCKQARVLHGLCELLLAYRSSPYRVGKLQPHQPAGCDGVLRELGELLDEEVDQAISTTQLALKDGRVTSGSEPLVAVVLTHDATITQWDRDLALIAEPYALRRNWVRLLDLKKDRLALVNRVDGEYEVVDSLRGSKVTGEAIQRFLETAIWANSTGLFELPD